MKGLGTDIVEVERLMEAIAQYGQFFIDHILTPREQKLTPQYEKVRRSFYAGRWAAKEAVAKALGCGFGEECGWLDIEILRNDLGAPYVELSGAAQRRARRCGIAQVQISISHEEHYAVATAIALEG